MCMHGSFIPVSAIPTFRKRTELHVHFGACLSTSGQRRGPEGVSLCLSKMLMQHLYDYLSISLSLDKLRSPPFWLPDFHSTCTCVCVLPLCRQLEHHTKWLALWYKRMTPLLESVLLLPTSLPTSEKETPIFPRARYVHTAIYDGVPIYLHIDYQYKGVELLLNALSVPHCGPSKFTC